MTSASTWEMSGSKTVCNYENSDTTALSSLSILDLQWGGSRYNGYTTGRLVCKRSSCRTKRARP